MPTSPEDPGLKPWKPRQSVESARLNALQAAVVTDITVGKGLRINRHGNQVALNLIDALRNAPVEFYDLTLFGQTIWGGVYQCQVYDSATAVPLDMSGTGGTLPDAYFGAGFRQDSGGPQPAMFYCRNTAEATTVAWTLLAATRNKYVGVDRGEKASDGTRVLLLISEFGVKACSQAMTAADMNSGF